MRRRIFLLLSILTVFLAVRRERRIAKVAMARKLAVSLLWMWRNAKFGSYVGQPGTALGAQ